MIKYLFFDFDGTISDAHGVIVKTLITVLDEYGYSFDHNQIVERLGEKLQVFLKDYGVSPSHLEGIRNKFYEKMGKESVIKEIKPCVSLEPLKELSKKYPLIIVSNSETDFVKASLKRLKAEKLFKEVYGAEKFSTKDKMLQKLFKKYKIKPWEAVYIGDRFSDIEYSRRAKCLAVSIHNKCSWSDLNSIKKEKPDYIISDFNGLKKILVNLEKR